MPQRGSARIAPTGSLRVLAAALPLACAVPLAAAEPARPKVLLLIGDDLGPPLGCYGDTLARTPRLDALAQESWRFTRAYVTAPSCSPSRGTLRTGLLPHQNGQIALTHLGRRMHTPVTTLPAWLTAAGGFSATLGKIHSAPLSQVPLDYPWDDGPGEPLSGKDRETTPGWTQYAANLTGSIDRITAAAGVRPWYLHLSLQDPHEPFFSQADGLPAGPQTAGTMRPFPFQRDPLPPQQAGFNAGYCHGVARCDALTGTVIEHLNTRALFANTVVGGGGDNGPPYGRAKASCYDAGLRVPLMIRWPDAAAKVIDTPVSTLDRAPTVAGILGATVPKLCPGRDLRAFRDGAPADWPTTVYGEMEAHPPQMAFPMRTITDGRWRLIVNPLVEHTRSVVPGEDPPAAWQPPKEGTARTCIGILRGFWRSCAVRPPVELSDTGTDPGCNTNLAEDPAHQERRAALETALTGWEKRTEDTFRDEATLAQSRTTIDGIVVDPFGRSS